METATEKSHRALVEPRHHDRGEQQRWAAAGSAHLGSPPGVDKSTLAAKAP